VRRGHRQEHGGRARNTPFDFVIEETHEIVVLRNHPALYRKGGCGAARCEMGPRRPHPAWHDTQANAVGMSVAREELAHGSTAHAGLFSVEGGIRHAQHLWSLAPASSKNACYQR